MQISIVAILLASCAHVQPSSEPSSLPWFVPVVAGQPSQGDGFFLSDEDARAFLKQRAMHELDLEQDRDREHLLRMADDKALAHAEWCRSWCLPMVGVGALLVGGFLGVEIDRAGHR